MAGLLKGVRVIESAQLLITPQVTQHLADEGADVIKLESPFRGDYQRDFLGQVKPHTKGHSPAFLAVNRNKRSIAVDLRTAEGRAVVTRLLATADVLFDGNAPGAVDKLGLGFADVAAVKPDIVYARLSGFGATGPYARVPTHGMSMTALAGEISVGRGSDGFAAPVPPDPATTMGPISIGMAPMHTAFAIAAALFRRSVSGQGASIDIGVADADVAANSFQVLRTFADIGADQSGQATAAVGGDNPKYNFYETADGHFLLAALIERHFYEHFCHGLGRDDLLAEGVGFNPGSTDVDWGPLPLRATLRDIFLTRTLEEWMAFAVEHDTVLAPINTVADLRTDRHLASREAVVDAVHPTAGPLTYGGNPVKVEGEHFTVYRHAPALGEHTTEVLAELGFDGDELADLRVRKVIGGPDREAS